MPIKEMQLKRLKALISAVRGWSTLKRRLIGLTLGAGAGMILMYFMLLAGLPGADEIKMFQPHSTVSQVSDWQVKPGQTVRIWVPIKRISPWLQKAVVISEDDLFYQHAGINWTTMREAFKVNWQKKQYVRGASTITMQLARNAFLHKRKTLLRKIRELILARRIEKHLSKSRILELYLNIVEWGENIYGAEAAARYYFGKSAESLNLPEATLLAAMLPNPKYFNPFKRLESCKRMQKRVLRLMELSREISAEDVAFARISASQLRRGVPIESTTKVDSLEEAKYRVPALDTIPTFRPSKIDAKAVADTVAYRELFNEIPSRPRFPEN